MRKIYLLISTLIQLSQICSASSATDMNTITINDIHEGMLALISAPSPDSESFLQEMKNKNYLFIQEQKVQVPPATFIREYFPYLTLIKISFPEKYDLAYKIADYFGWILPRHEDEAFEHLNYGIDADNTTVIENLCEILSLCPTNVSFDQFARKVISELFSEQEITEILLMEIRRTFVNRRKYHAIRSACAQYTLFPDLILAAITPPNILEREMAYRLEEATEEQNIDNSLKTDLITKKLLKGKQENERDKNLDILLAEGISSHIRPSEVHFKEEIKTRYFYKNLNIIEDDLSDESCPLKLTEDYPLNCRETKNPASEKINRAWNTRYTKLTAPTDTLAI